MRALVLVAALLIAGPPLQISCARMVRPLTSGTRVQRGVEELRAGRLPDQRRRWRPLEEIDADLVQAVLVSEDQRFWLHRGFDLREVEAAVAAHRRGEGLRGASTLSMQTARTLFLWQGRSWPRKGIEAAYTAWLELLVPKERILELYLNEVEWGPQVFGAEAAARYHFARGADDLTRRQACALAAILPDPRGRDARAPGEAVRRKMDWIERQLDIPLPRPAAPADGSPSDEP